MAGTYTKTITLGLDYSGFEGSINQCNQKLKLLDAEFEHANTVIYENADAVDKASLKNDYLSQRLEIQKAKVEAAKQKYDALMNAHADQSKIDKADEALLRERTELHRLQNELDGASNKTQQYISVASALVATLAVVGSAFAKLAIDAAEYADNINTISQQSGASTEMVQTWTGMADVVDVSVETMSSAMSKLKKNMDSAANGSGTAAEAFKKLGVSVKDDHGNLRDASKVMYEVFDALNDMSNETEKDATAMAIFGKSADELAGAIDGGSEAYDQYNNKLRESGAILSGSTLDSLNAFNDALDEAKVNIQASKNEFGAMVADALLPLVQAFNDLPQPVRTVAVALGTITSQAAPAVAGLMALSMGMQVTGASATAALAPMIEFVAIVGAVVAVVAVVVAAVYVIVDALDDLATAFENTDKSASIFERAMSALSQFQQIHPILYGIADALAAPFTTIIDIIQAIIKVIQALIDKLMELKSVWTSSSNDMAGVSSLGQNSIGHNASGTENWRGGLTWVGEEGPELVSLPQGSRVYNSTDSRNMATTNNISISLDLSRMKSVNDVVNAVQNLGISMGGI